MAVITPAAMVATALASGMRVLRADALARAALQRRGRRGSNPPSFRRRRGSGAPRFERGRSGIGFGGGGFHGGGGFQGFGGEGGFHGGGGAVSGGHGGGHR
ncbi:hypothetical protein [Roseiarcus sp.]|uniref:hypothetical protein n=1 Tax=Roseiarcus sp. TaxID=1969460 RepID=UPI003D11BEA7